MNNNNDLRNQAKALLDSIPDQCLKMVVNYLTVLTGQEIDFSAEMKENKTATNAASNKIVIYTDGGCHGNPGPGGWGVVVVANGEARELSGGEKNTTNNRMELSAAINALSVVKNTPSFSGKQVEIYTDSQYVKNGITSWVKGWKKNGWITSAKKPVLNKELWEQLDALNEAVMPNWNWVKGHAGIEYNEICDQLCQKEIALFD